MGRNWAIVVGINNYNNLQQLKCAKRDAEAMETWFQDEARFDAVLKFTEDSPTIYQVDIYKANPPIPTQPTYGNFRRFLRANFEKPLLETGDNLWFFFAGHGCRENDRDYLMFLDSDPGDVEHTAIPIDYVTQRLRRSGADNVVLFLDACRNEGGRGGLGIGKEHPGVITFYSCSPQEKAYEIEALNQGSFTHVLLEALRIQGEGNCATVERLNQHLYNSVPELNRRYNQPRQTPYTVVDPATKLHLILLPKQATLKDVAILKTDAFEAEVQGNLELAEQLWIRVLAVSSADRQAINAIKRIGSGQGQPIPHPNPETVISSTTQPVTSSRGDTPTPKNQLPIFQFEIITVNDRGKEIRRDKRQAEYFTENLGNGVTLEMVAIPGGSFTMGALENEEGSTDDERPQHQVTVQPFFIGKYPITQAQWRVVAALPKVERDLKSDPSFFKGDRLPVECVTWYDAVEFCARLARKTGRDYRLPSEAEWEYACRAGTTTPFHFGETITTDLANYRGTDIREYKWSGSYGNAPKGEYREQTTPVDSFPPNAFGLYDMHGNVWEWCQDTWHENYQGAPTDGRAWLSENENDNDNYYRLLRGGSWYVNPGNCRSASRYRTYPDYDDNLIGFRVVCFVAPRTK
ncbi:SUMF1/EgtB/PvdO family nonheme iron enzyme [Fischerella sp. FACHB-380]|uniref:SUMF1/EgtB/PvdO family nonheme iron enzyme n=1 Tax=Fischerella sp. FACHB-380 TaxID=2692799 RepID=UPI00168A39CC|nr:SUMF1/EgtB/PvdO family nonheme iron enzyme [Fischerella sp. FACHB-380]MBD2429863.1 SUMF1/EgtB/PvdO family nonheme iron enzyme [Fischerella sp. FACHB-380]